MNERRQDVWVEFSKRFAVSEAARPEPMDIPLPGSTRKARERSAIRSEADRRAVEAFRSGVRVQAKQSNAYFVCGVCDSECAMDGGKTTCCNSRKARACSWKQIQARREHQWEDRLEQMAGKAR